VIWVTGRLLLVQGRGPGGVLLLLQYSAAAAARC
jgi:hypothetical protein